MLGIRTPIQSKDSGWLIMIQGFWLVDLAAELSEVWLVVQHLYLQYGIYMRAQLLGVSTPPAISLLCFSAQNSSVRDQRPN